MKSFPTFYQQSRWPKAAHSFTILSTSQVFAPGRCLLFVLSAPPMWHHLKHGFVQVLEPDFKLTPLLFYCWAALDSNLISHFIHASICIYWPPRASDKHRANKGFWASAVRILGNGAYLGMRAYIRQWRGGYSNCTPSSLLHIVQLHRAHNCQLWTQIANVITNTKNANSNLTKTLNTNGQRVNRNNTTKAWGSTGISGLD